MYGETLPELPATETLHDMWRQLHYAREGISGAQPFEWREIQAYADLAGHDLAPYEAHCIMDMSRAYCSEIGNKDALRKAPMERDT